MFGKSFTLVFGVGAGIVAAISLAAAVVGLVVGAFWLVGSLMTPAKAAGSSDDFAKFAALCTSMPPEWKDYGATKPTDFKAPKPVTELEQIEEELRRRARLQELEYRKFIARFAANCRLTGVLPSVS